MAGAVSRSGILGAISGVDTMNQRDRLDNVMRRLTAPTPTLVPPVVPIDMVLHCPACGLQHIDAPEGPCEAGQCKYSEDVGVPARCAIGCEYMQPGSPRWTNPPHRSHLCGPMEGGCGHTWRPADVPTNGVEAIKTKGKNDSEQRFTKLGWAPTVAEHRREYANAQVFAAVQIWASIQRHDGDPCWSWGRDPEGTIVESLT